MSAPLTLSHRLEYAVFRVAAAILRAMPVERASALSGAGWRLVAPRLKRHKRALANIAAALPETTPAERERIARDMWDNLGRVFAETFHLDEIIGSDRLRIVDETQVRASLPHDRRFVACTAHIGNWELGAGVCLAFGARPAGVYQRIRNPLVDAYVRGMRGPFYPGGLVHKSDGAARRLLRHVRDGGAFVTMADLRDWRGVAVPFFGRPAPSSPFPALVARTLGAPLYVGMVAREPQGDSHVRFAVTMRPVEMPHTDDRDADIAEGTRRLQAEIEHLVRQKPEQWMWAHRRWG